MNTIMHEPWPWYVTGPLFGLSIPLLLFFGNKMLGVSSALRHICAVAVPTKTSYFNYNVKDDFWNILFALGILFGGVFTRLYMHNPQTIHIADSTREDLQKLGITNFNGWLPEELFGLDQLFSLQGITLMLTGGFLIGFGVRYAGGCTSGHGFMGLSQGSIASLVAVISFFAGGILMTHMIFPLIF